MRRCEGCGVEVYGPVGRNGPASCSDRCRQRVHRRKDRAGDQLPMVATAIGVMREDIQELEPEQRTELAVSLASGAVDAPGYVTGEAWDVVVAGLGRRAAQKLLSGQVYEERIRDGVQAESR